MELTILSNEEQKAEAVRAIVTAQHELNYLSSKGHWFYDDELVSVSIRRNDACEWLSLC